MRPPTRKSKPATHFAQVPLAAVKQAVALTESADALPKNFTRERSAVATKPLAGQAPAKPPRSR